MLKQVNQKSCPFYADDIVLYELCSGNIISAQLFFLQRQDKGCVVFYFKKIQILKPTLQDTYI